MASVRSASTDPSTTAPGIESRLARLAKLARDVFDVSTVVIAPLREDAGWVASSCGPAVPSLPPTAWPGWTVARKDGLFALDDLDGAAELAPHPWIGGSAAIRGYACMLLRSGSGHPMGAMALLSRAPLELTQPQLLELRDLGALAERELGPFVTSQPPSALIIDDLGSVRLVLSAQLQRLDYHTVAVSNGEDGLRAFAEAAFQLVLTDLQLPRMDGFSVAREMRRLEAERTRAYIVGVSGATGPTALAAALASGMDELIQKPIDLATIRRLASARAERPVVRDRVEPDEPVRLDEIHRLLGGPFVADTCGVIESFIDEARNDLARLRAGTPVGRESAASFAHRQLSAGRTIGASRWIRLAEQLEQSARSEAFQSTQALVGFDEALMEVADWHEQFVRAATRGETPSGMARPGGAEAPCDSLMVVDDDPVTRHQLSVAARCLGVPRVESFASASLALERVASHPPEVVICDLHMPGMDGVELVRSLGARGAKSGVILLSGGAETILRSVGHLARLEGLEVLGAERKPLGVDRLGELLRQRGRVDATSSSSPPTAARSFDPPWSALDLRQALANGEVRLWYQPKVSLENSRAVGVEALARWHSPTWGDVPPSAFIEVAERRGLIAELTRSLFPEALSALQVMRTLEADLTLAFNLSVASLVDRATPEFLLEATRDAGLAPSDVILEVTEMGETTDVRLALEVFARLRMNGFGLSIDDLGTGVSSLERLEHLPFTELKLDRKFVSRAHTDAAARAILETSMDFARRFGLDTVAEGIETREQLELVRALGCRTAQGFLFGRPMPLEQIERWLAAPTAP